MPRDKVVESDADEGVLARFLTKSARCFAMREGGFGLAGFLDAKTFSLQTKGFHIGRLIRLRLDHVAELLLYALVAAAVVALAVF